MTARGVVALLAVAALMAGCTSRTGGAAPDPTERTSAAAEDLADMLAETEAAVETLNTIDAADAEGSLDEWESVVTGDLLAELRSSRADNVESLTTAATSGEGEVLEAAATEFDGEDGTAEVLAVVKIVVTAASAEPTEKQTRQRFGVTRTDDGWKIDSVETVPIGG